MNHARPAAVVLIALVSSHCGSASRTPTAPNSPGASSSLPTVRAVLVSRTNVDAGDEISLSATLDGASAPGQFRFVWSVEPQAGAMSPDGPTLRWRAPVDDPVPTTYVFTVTPVQTSQTAIGSPGVPSASSLAASSPPVTVNDARRELIAHSEAFLKDAADVTVSPAMCVRNFTDSCQGKQSALDDLTAGRAAYSLVSNTYDLQLFVRSVEWTNCIAPDGSARCALLIYDVTWTRTRRADHVEERAIGTEYLQGFYERNRWWLCGARFEAQ